jgi:hypothetical protein
MSLAARSIASMRLALRAASGACAAALFASTVAASPALAQSAGRPDVVGIELGMPIAEARSKVAAALDGWNNQLKPNEWKGTSHDMQLQVLARRVLGESASDFNKPYVAEVKTETQWGRNPLVVHFYPLDETVACVLRGFKARGEDEAFGTDAFVSSLISKYGEPTHVVRRDGKLHEMLWLKRADGGVIKADEPIRWRDRKDSDVTGPAIKSVESQWTGGDCNVDRHFSDLAEMDWRGLSPDVETQILARFRRGFSSGVTDVIDEFWITMWSPAGALRSQAETRAFITAGDAARRGATQNRAAPTF